MVARTIAAEGFATDSLPFVAADCTVIAVEVKKLTEPA
jgi:hypothetical protein